MDSRTLLDWDLTFMSIHTAEAMVQSSAYVNKAYI